MIQGANGAGKSTLLRTLSGLIPKKEGEVFFQGKAVSTSRFLQALCFLKPDRCPFYPELTLQENLHFFARLFHKKDFPLELKEMAENLKLKPFWNIPMQFLSYGTKEKIGFLYCALGAKKIKCFDEPFSGLDFESCAQINHYFQTWKKKGDLVIFSSHQPPENLAWDQILTL